MVLVLTVASRLAPLFIGYKGQFSTPMPDNGFVRLKTSVSNRSSQRTVLINPSVNEELPKAIKFAIDLVSLLINFTCLCSCYFSTISFSP